MLNYIKSEFYRIFNKKSTWVILTIPSLIGIIINVAIYCKNSNLQPVDGVLVMIAGINILKISLFYVITMIDITTAQENKMHTLKNVVAFGIPRSKIFLSKVIVASLLTIIGVSITLITFIASVMMLFGIAQGFSFSIFTTLLLKFLVTIVIWIAAITIGTFLAMFFNNSTIFTLSYIGIFVVLTKEVINGILGMITGKLNWVGDILIQQQMEKVCTPIASNKELISSSLISLAYIIVFMIIGIKYFSKKEIK